MLFPTLILTGFGAGCFPAVYVDRMALRGRIVDPQDRPIAGALVRVTQTRGRGRDRSITLTTGPDGRFAAPADWRFYIASLIPFELDWVAFYDVSVERGGYSEVLEPMPGQQRVGSDSDWFWARGPTVDFGTRHLPDR